MLVIRKNIVNRDGTKATQQPSQCQRITLQRIMNPDDLESAAESVGDDSKLTPVRCTTSCNGRALQSMKSVINKNASLPKAAMYEVNIAATPDEFIDWDLPLE
jgi:hypothetical protein